jgi:PKD repeat protein
MAFFMTSPSAAPWFLERGQRRGDGPAAAIEASAHEGPSPLAATFRTSAAWPGRYFWSFGDGTSSVEAQPRKTFYRDGVYDVRLTMTDAAGRWVAESVQVRVGAAAAPRGRP